MKTSICREYEFAAAHELPLHAGKCQRLHGHNYTLEVEVAGPVRGRDWKSSYGMVMDFAELDAAVQGILDEVDHYNLNDRLSPLYPTAENVAGWIFGILDVAVSVGRMQLELVRVRLYETPRSWAEVRA